MNETLLQLIFGGLIVSYLIAGLFFFKFWRVSRDPLFILFAAAFLVLAVQRLLLALSSAAIGEQAHLYGLRWLAYLLFLAAIVNKNRGEKVSVPPPAPRGA